MRILVVAHAFPPEGCGGTERYAEAAARALQARGHSLLVFTGSLEWRARFEVVRAVDRGLPVTRVHRSDLYFDHWDKGSNPFVARAFEDELGRFRPDVVHLHQWIRLSDDLLRRAAAHGVPALVHLHDLFVTCPRVFRMRPDPAEEAEADDVVVCDEPLGPAACTGCVPRWRFQDDASIGAAIERRSRELSAELASAAALVAPLRGHAELVARHAARAGLVIDELPHPRLPGGIEGPGRDARSPAGALRLLYFSHLLPMKGAHVVLEAMGRLGAGSGISLDVHGPFATPGYEARLRRLAEGLEVRFHGAYAADEPCRTAADVAVVPTLARESWSFWLDEAARLGLPIVAAGSGAVAQRATGRVRLYPAHDAAALARALIELRDDPALRRALAAAPPPPTWPLDAHAAALEERLEAVVRAGAPATPPPPPPEALVPEFELREAEFGRLLRTGGPAEPHGRLRAEIERRLQERRDAGKGSGGGPPPAETGRARPE